MIGTTSIRIIKTNRIRWRGHVSLISELRNWCQNLVKKEKSDDNIKMYLKETGYGTC
jgi:hypothetical protein